MTLKYAVTRTNGQGDVLVFGVVANVVAAAGALTAGRIDDRAGPKAVIVVSLAGMLACGTALLFSSGPAAFWVLDIEFTYERNIRHGIPADFRIGRHHALEVWRT